MTYINIHMQVGHLVADRPERSRVFERYEIDYCCSGKRSLEDACRDRGLDPAAVLAELQTVDADATQEGVIPADMTMTELADHIEATHHVYLREELPRLQGLVDKVMTAHGKRYPWLEGVQSTYRDLVAELNPHMLKEEQILFPMIRELDSATVAPSLHCGSVSNPIGVMEHEHANAGAALRRLRELTSGFEVPEGGCDSFRAMVDGLRQLEADTHAHIHKENNVLFVRAAEAEGELRGSQKGSP